MQIIIIYITPASANGQTVFYPRWFTCITFPRMHTHAIRNWLTYYAYRDVMCTAANNMHNYTMCTRTTKQTIVIARALLQWRSRYTKGLRRLVVIPKKLSVWGDIYWAWSILPEILFADSNVSILTSAKNSKKNSLTRSRPKSEKIEIAHFRLV